MTQSSFLPAKVEGTAVLARVGFYNRNGDEVRSIVFKPTIVGRKAHEVGSKDQLALVQRVVNYFHLQGPVDERTTYGLSGKTVPLVIGDPNHPVVYTPVLSVYGNPRNVWTITLLQHKASSLPTLAYDEDDGAFAAYFLSTLENDIMVNATAAKPAKAAKEPAAPKEKVIKGVSDLPLASKPNSFMLAGKEYPVKVFGKTHREMANPDGAGRIEDPNTPRTAKDDVFTYAATHYQLGKVSAVHWTPKALIIVAANGLGILQSIRKGDKEEVAALVEKLATKGGFKGTIADLK